MSMLPWDNWFYHTDYKKGEVNTLLKNAHDTIASIDKLLPAFNEKLGQVRDLAKNNASLIFAADVIEMTDAQHDKVESEIPALLPRVDGNAGLSIGGLIMEGGASTIIAIWLGKGAKVAYQAVKGTISEALTAARQEVTAGAEEIGLESLGTGTTLTAETVGEGASEAVATEAIEGLSLAGLGALSAVGIVAALGIDAIFGAINGKKEAEELDAQIDTLSKQSNKLTKILQTLMFKELDLDRRVTEEINRFARVSAALAAIPTPKHSDSGDGDKTQYKTADLPGAIKASAQAVQVYGFVASIRDAVKNMRANAPDMTADQLVTTLLLISRKGTYMKDELLAVLHYLAEYSDDVSEALKK